MNATSRSQLIALVVALASLAPLSAQERAAKTADRPAQAVTTVAPKYPYLMRRAEVPAEVTVSFLVDAKGRVADLKVINAFNPEFINPAVDALKEWTFTPALKDGKPVASRVTQTFTFSVRGEPEAVNAAHVANAKRAR